MPLFEYKALTAKGKATSGQVEADGPAELRAKLAKDGLFLTGFSEAGGKVIAGRGGAGKASVKGGAAPAAGGSILARLPGFGTLLRPGQALRRG